MPAGQLAIIARIAPQTASSHLSKLVGGRLLAVEQQGRHRYYRLANIHVANAIEALLSITPRPKSSSLSSEAPIRALEYARTCYSHLAGRLAVEIADALSQRGFIRAAASKEYRAPTNACRAWFEELGVPMTDARMKRPRFARQCLDWTERRHHIAVNWVQRYSIDFRIQNGWSGSAIREPYVSPRRVNGAFGNSFVFERGRRTLFAIDLMPVQVGVCMRFTCCVMVAMLVDEIRAAQ